MFSEYGKLFTKLHRPVFALICFLLCYPSNNHISNKLHNSIFVHYKAFPSGYSRKHSIDTISQQLYSISQISFQLETDIMTTPHVRGKENTGKELSLSSGKGEESK